MAPEQKASAAKQVQGDEVLGEADYRLARPSPHAAQAELVEAHPQRQSISQPARSATPRGLRQAQAERLGRSALSRQADLRLF